MNKQEEIIVMKAIELNLNNNRVVVVDAPIVATHASIIMTDAPVKNQMNKILVDGATFAVHKKSKLIATYCFDSLKDAEGYIGRIVVIGSLKTADETYLAELFNPVKRGNFCDYEHLGVFYPSAVSALKDVINQEVNFVNPYVLIIKPL